MTGSSSSAASLSTVRNRPWACPILVVLETNEPQANIWKQPLKGWRWLAGWTVVVVTLAALTGIVLSLTTTLPWLLCIGIALLVAILMGLLVRCLSSGRSFK